MADTTGLEGHLEGQLADLAASGRQFAVPLAAEQIRARGERRRRRKQAARMSGGVLLIATLAVGGLSLSRLGQEPAPPAAKPTPSAPRFVPPTPAPGQEYASELGYVFGALSSAGGKVQVTVKQLRSEQGAVVPTGVVHKLTLPSETPVEVEHLTGGKPGDMELGELVGRLRAGARWVFAIDYDGDGRVQSLREVFWLDAE